MARTRTQKRPPKKTKNKSLTEKRRTYPKENEKHKSDGPQTSD
jgi:hypothetical protein